MALKDWKRAGKDSWQSINQHKANQSIDIDNDNSITIATHLYNGDSRITIEKSFKTKSQALRFAKSYMRTH